MRRRGVFPSLILLASVLPAAAASAAPVTVNGASLDAPATCSAAERALVCKVDGQQLELWVNRKFVADYLEPDEPFAQKMAWFQELHETAVANIMRSTFNDKRSAFSAYGPYPALGTSLPGRGAPTSPAVRFASVLYEDSYWEFLEVTAARTPAIDAISSALEHSLKLPKADPARQPIARKQAPAPTAPAADAAKSTTASAPATMPAAAPQPAVPAPPPAPETGASPLSATFNGTRLSFDHPGYLTAKLLNDTAGEYSVQMEHKTRKSGGPSVTLTWRAGDSGDASTEARANALRDDLTATLAGTPQTATLSRFGALPGHGFAVLGAPRARAGTASTEQLQTVFIADSKGGRLEVRLVAEQAYAGEAQTVWAMIAQTLAVKN